MSAASDKINTAINQICDRIIEVTATYKPTYSIDGESYSHESYLNSLTASLAALKQTQQVLEGPFQKIVRMR